jgi:hypothetical protein
MSIKKELLQRLTEQQLRELVEHKGLKFSISTEKKKYYEKWLEKDKLVDLMTDNQNITISDIENYIMSK